MAVSNFPQLHLYHALQTHHLADPDESYGAGPRPGADGPATILIAEDDPAVRSLLARVLRARGYLVVEAANGVEAVAAAEGRPQPFDLLLTDVVMPKLNGIELAARLLDGGQARRVIFMTGYADVPLGPDDHATILHKPFTPSTLADAVREALSQ